MADVKKYVTPPFRVSFPAVFEAKTFDGGKAKYGVTAVWHPNLFTDKDKVKWRAILGGLDAMSKDIFKSPWKELPANIKRGLRDGAEKPELEGFGKGTYFASLTSMMRPGVVDRAKQPIGPEHDNEDKVYPGCWARATVTIYSYNNKGKGVAIGLQNLQLIKDDGRLDARTDAAEDFDGEEIDDSWLDDDTSTESDDAFDL